MRILEARRVLPDAVIDQTAALLIVLADVLLLPHFIWQWECV
jgi:hypothetical protein